MLKLIICFAFVGVATLGAMQLRNSAVSAVINLQHTVAPPSITQFEEPLAPAGITQLTRDPTNALRPTWSPNGSSIAFDSNRDGPFHIYVMNADGSSVRALTTGANDDRHPFWSSGGKVIVYDSADGTHQDVWSVSVADGKRVQLTHADGLADFAALSPDGRYVAYYVYKDFELEIWSAHSDGSNARPLTSGLANARKNQPTTAWHQVAWSPDSEWLAYTGGDGTPIWIMRADGSLARPVIRDGETNHFPWFLADGRLAFITEYVPPRYGDSWTNAWAYNLDTGERALLLEHMRMQGPMDISPDNSQVLFSSPRGGHFDIYQINLNVPGGMAALQGADGGTAPRH